MSISFIFSASNYFTVTRNVFIIMDKFWSLFTVRLNTQFYAGKCKLALDYSDWFGGENEVPYEITT